MKIDNFPIDEGEEKLFSQLIDVLYGNRSTIFTTNAIFKSWKEPRRANAILDRILFHVKVVDIVGDSNRLKKHVQMKKKS